MPTFVRKHRRRLFLVLLDIAIVFAALALATQLRFEWAVPARVMDNQWRRLPYILLTYAGVLGLFNIYSIMWRYAGSRQLLYQSAVIAGAGALTLLWNGLFAWGLSRAVLVNACLFAMALAGASRLAARSVRARMAERKRGGKAANGDAPALLVVGAGDAGSYVVDLARRNNHSFGRPIALVDDAPDKQRMSVQGVPVRGTVADVPRLAKDLHIREIVIAMPSVKGERIKEVIAICNATKCRVRMLSDPAQVEEEYRQGKITMREPNIADFLSREEVSLDVEEISGYLSGETVLVTGGGGSIGSEICRQVMKFRPAQLLIFDVYENCAYELLIELQQAYGKGCPVKVLVGTIRDRARLDEVMQRYRPGVVFHAAAHKHVPLMEESPAEAVKNNVFGTLNLLESAAAHGVKRFVQLSTDKAVNPTNVMGATKRVTELLIQRFAGKADMKCMAVRFGNVLGSHGSVIPLFERQIKAGGPVTLTHPDITRYFMTIPEAAQLVLQAGSMEDSGAIYILDMGEPVRIMDLAEKLIRFYGFEPNADMPVVISGLRPGEKMHEELLLDEEQGAVRKTSHDKILAAPPLRVEGAFLVSRLDRLQYAADSEPETIDSILKELVPTFVHAGNGGNA